jgi:hypothetical protein
MGKSRLVFELLQLVEIEPELTIWRQGRCLPYGEGVALWALGEIVKARPASWNRIRPSRPRLS